jgi:hypothetical protein
MLSAFSVRDRARRTSGIGPAGTHKSHKPCLSRIASCYRSLHARCENRMITAAEYRTWAEQWAGEAATPQEREAHIKSAEVWIESTLR